MQTRSVRRGRKRKLGPRERDGRLQRDRSAATLRQQEREQERETLSVALDARVRLGLAANLNQARDPRAASLLGRLEMSGGIAPQHLAAAELYARSARLHARAIDAPRPYPQAADGPTVEITPAEASFWIDDWETAQEALRRAGAVVASVTHVAIIDGACSERDLDMLISGLEALREYYRLEEPAKDTSEVAPPVSEQRSVKNR